MRAKNQFKNLNTKGNGLLVTYPFKINFIPPATIIHLWEEDYRLMRSSMIYGEAKDFKELIERLDELIERLGILSWGFEFIGLWKTETLYRN